MKRNARKVRWTKAFRKAAGKEMTLDTTLEFEKRRNVPLKYDREHMATTLKAIQRVDEIKQKRAKAFFKNRMSTAAPASLERDALEVTRSSHLLGHTPTPLTEKAVAAAAKKLAAREARKRARQQPRVKDLLSSDKVAEEEEEEDVEMEEVEEAPVVVEREKIKIKTKIRNRPSALLRATEGQSMSMDM